MSTILMGASVSHPRLHILSSLPEIQGKLRVSIISFSFGEALLPLESGAFLWGENFWEATLPLKKIFGKGPFWAFTKPERLLGSVASF